MLEGLNFKEFIALLSAFSARATQDDKLKCESFIEYYMERNLSSLKCVCVWLLI